MRNSGMKDSKGGQESRKKNQHDTVEVLYQKMGDRWFAFSLIDDEVFVGSIAQSEIDAALIHVNENGSEKLSNGS